ncbi:MAG: transketolase [Epulopiscium sp. Nuni2H_MBin003]|nr:MAG: transketolase [Epulopiscium sp. Nuni2H_MBin003]
MFKLVKKILPEPFEAKTAFSKTMDEMASADENVIYLDCDLMASIDMTEFAKKFPTRAINCGIQEANMIGVACGASLIGLKPFTHTFGPFATRRVIDQIYISGAYGKTNIKMIGSDAGVTAMYNGGTHMPVEDMGLLRTIPDVTLLEPTDSVMMCDLLRQIKDLDGVYYMRVTRKVTDQIFEEGSTFEIGKALTLKEGSDITIITSGCCTSDVLHAHEELATQGINAEVINIFTWKPIDAEAIINSAKKTNAVLIVENHNIINGLGSAVCEILSENIPVISKRLGVPDRFGEVGSMEYLKETFGMSIADIVTAAKELINKK